jgi:hypothetical protein
MIGAFSIGGNGEAIARFEHRQSVYRRQLPEQ